MAASSDAQGSAPSVSLWNDPKKRALIYQAIVLIALIIVAAYIINNTAANLEKRGIASGFGFLQSLVQLLNHF